MAKKRVFFVWSKEVVTRSGSATELPARFDTREEAEARCERENRDRPAGHPGYFVTEQEVDD